MVGAKIKEYLDNHGIKQSWLASKVGLSPSQMSDICIKDRTIDCVVYFKICKVLNVPLEEFLKDFEVET
jgi:transcriptional regulator with XRE-family HTH domain